MSQIHIQVEGADDEDIVSDLLEDQGSGFESERMRTGRSRRHSNIGQVVALLGHIVAVAKFAETLLKVLRLPRAEKKDKVVIRLQGPNGKTVTVSGKNKDDLIEVLKNIGFHDDTPTGS